MKLNVIASQPWRSAHMKGHRMTVEIDGEPPVGFDEISRVDGHIILDVHEVAPGRFEVLTFER